MGFFFLKDTRMNEPIYGTCVFHRFHSRRPDVYFFFYLYGEPLWECESLVGWDNANEYLPEIDPDIFTQLGMSTCCSFMKWMVVFVSFQDINRAHMLG